MYIYQHADWPGFVWDEAKLTGLLAEVSHKQGRLIGRMERLGFSLQSEASLLNMTSEILKSHEIEGEILDSDQVRSSIARRFGMNIAGLVPSDRSIDGVVEAMIDATQDFESPLTKSRLFGWHAALFPTGHSGMHRIVVGAWRDNHPDDPMQVVSGAMGKEKVHLQAPPANQLSREMTKFFKWFNTTTMMQPIIKAGVAHLWFITIHPFDDGNGRLARTITDMQLTRADKIKQRFYSMSTQIRQERKAYYQILEKTQKGSLDITAWLEWFLACLGRALDTAEDTLSGVIYKARYWDLLVSKSLNDRQRLMLNRLLDGFYGKLTTSKWAKITKCSQDTALRDIQNLIDQDVLEKENAGGRSTNYRLIALNSENN